MSLGALGLLLLPQPFGSCPLGVGRCAVLWDVTVDNSDKKIFGVPLWLLWAQPSRERKQHASIGKEVGRERACLATNWKKIGYFGGAGHLVQPKGEAAAPRAHCT